MTTCEPRKHNSRLTNIYALINNIQNDVFRYCRKALGYVILFALGYLVCFYIDNKEVDSVVCEVTVIDYSLPNMLPATGTNIY